jgi:hypothetical protein
MLLPIQSILRASIPLADCTRSRRPDALNFQSASTCHVLKIRPTSLSSSSRYISPLWPLTLTCALFRPGFRAISSAPKIVRGEHWHAREAQPCLPRTPVFNCHGSLLAFLGILAIDVVGGVEGCQIGNTQDLSAEQIAMQNLETTASSLVS